MSNENMDSKDVLSYITEKIIYFIGVFFMHSGIQNMSRFFSGSWKMTPKKFQKHWEYWNLMFCRLPGLPSLPLPCFTVSWDLIWAFQSNILQFQVCECVCMCLNICFSVEFVPVSQLFGGVWWTLTVYIKILMFNRVLFLSITCVQILWFDIGWV